MLFVVLVGLSDWVILDGLFLAKILASTDITKCNADNHISGRQRYYSTK